MAHGKCDKNKGTEVGLGRVEWEGLFQTVLQLSRGSVEEGGKISFWKQQTEKGGREGGSIYYADPTKEPFILRP